MTAASELARNTLVYGGGGPAEVEVVTDGRGAGSGPRSPTGARHRGHRLALTDGWTSGTGMGLGLSGARRLVDDFELRSDPGSGTGRVVKWTR